MNHTHAFLLAIGLTSAAIASAAVAGPKQDAVIAAYAERARAADPSFAGFDVAAGKAFFFANHTGGGVETPACTSCHTDNIGGPGKTRAGKPIDPMAVSVQGDRYTDLAKVDKWIGRNCNSVLGRDCTAREAGDVISWLASQ